MALIKIYYTRKTSPTATSSRTVEFDSVMGAGIDKNYPHDFIFHHDGVTFFNDRLALQEMAKPNWGGKTFFEIIPILPKLPPQYFSTTIWLSYPENIPTGRPDPYRCHFLFPDGTIGLTWLLWDPSVWNLMKVFEWTESAYDNTEKILNPAYASALEAYNQKWEEYRVFLHQHFLLYQNLRSPIIPTVKDNHDLIPSIMVMLNLQDPTQIPDNYFWHWFLGGKGGRPIDVQENQYKFAPRLLDEPDNLAWTNIHKNTVKLTDPYLKMKWVLRCF